MKNGLNLSENMHMKYNLNNDGSKYVIAKSNK